MIYTITPKTQKTWFDTATIGSCELHDLDLTGCYLRIDRIGVDSSAIQLETSGCTPCGIQLPPRCSPNSMASICEPSEAVSLEYDILDVEGTRFCVFWDNLIHQQPSGRYVARVVNKSGCTVAEFTIDIPSGRLAVRDAESISSAC